MHGPAEKAGLFLRKSNTVGQGTQKKKKKKKKKYPSQNPESQADLCLTSQRPKRNLIRDFSQKSL